MPNLRVLLAVRMSNRLGAGKAELFLKDKAELFLEEMMHRNPITAVPPLRWSSKRSRSFFVCREPDLAAALTAAGPETAAFRLMRPCEGL